MRIVYLIPLSLVAFSALTPPVAAGILQSAENFTVLGGSTVTNTGPTSITGNVGVSPGSAITGTVSITLTGTYHAGDAVALQAQTDVTKAYNGLKAMSSNQNLTGQDLGGLTLNSGVYKFDSEAQLTGALTLDAQGNNNAFWVFQIGDTLKTANASSVNMINVGSHGGTDNGLFWQVGSSATLGTTTAFEGNILALASITLNTGATIDNGRALAETGAVTMDTNTLSQFSAPPDYGTLSGGLTYDSLGNVVPVGPSAVPEPSSFALFASGMAALFLLRKRYVSAIQKTVICL